MKRFLQKPAIGVFPILVLYLLQACATPAASMTVEPPIFTPTAEPIPLSQQVILTFISFKEEGQSPNYTISAQTPKLAGSDDPRVQAFNQKMEGIIQTEIGYFRENILAQMSPTPIVSGSFFEETYTLVLQSGNLWSIKFDFMGFADGGAHPYHYSRSVNYDLENGRIVSLDEFFLPGAHPLNMISRYCIAELSKRDIGFYGGFQDGATPTQENYRNWNITTNGILITFDEYQVAPYAAGPQTVTVPYSYLHEIIDLHGLLGRLSQ